MSPVKVQMPPEESKVEFSKVDECDEPLLTFHTRSVNEYKNELNVNSNPHQGLYILSSFGKGTANLPFKMLIDCGAAMSLLHRDVFDKIPESVRPPVEATTREIRLADGSFTRCEGKISMKLKVGQTVRNVDFLLGKYSDDAILGMKDLQSIGLSVNFETMQVTKGQIWIPCVDVNYSLVGRKVVVRRSVVLPARSQAIFQAESQS